MAKPSDLHTIIFLLFTHRHTHTHTNYTSPATNAKVLSLIACVCESVTMFVCTSVCYLHYEKTLLQVSSNFQNVWAMALGSRH